MIERVFDGQQTVAILIRDSFREHGIHFFTPPEYSQQLAFMHHPVGRIIEPHIHNPVPREVCYTQEVLFLKRGRMRVDFYNQQKMYLESRIMEAGDVILLASGGHGFEVLEEIEMIEVKQGPYTGEVDKSRFSKVNAADVVVKSDE